MRGYTPGGRFDADFESDSIRDGTSWDLTTPVGTIADCYVFDADSSTTDPIYDVDAINGGRVWKGPFTLRVTRASITQSMVPQSERGFYQTDTLHLTVMLEDMKKIFPQTDFFPEFANRSRIFWREQLYRPLRTQQSGIVKERFTVIVIDLQQVMPDEMTFDEQFLTYSL
jgi:hypothetical protein